MDISTLRETEEGGGKFFDGGKERPLLDILKDYGTTGVRLRLWNDPFDADGNSYLGGGCDIENLLATAKRAKSRGMSFMLDFHYSDFWTDPSRQLLPKAWRNKSLSETAGLVYEYTLKTLARCKSEGVYPDYVQIGNEITGGTLWPLGRVEYDETLKRRVGYESLAELLKAGVRGVTDSAGGGARPKVILHLERSGDNECYRDWFDNITRLGVEFDIIGLSYYPYWHGTLKELEYNMRDISARYGKDLMVVETSYAFTEEHFSKEPSAKLVISGNLPTGDAPPFPLTKDGQRGFIKALLETLSGIERSRGMYYWEPGWLPVPGSSWSSAGAREYMGESEKLGGNEWANQCLFDYQGRALPALGAVRDFAKKING
jgi:arabinogalactan endo-1,4-beta-galactosidase